MAIVSEIFFRFAAGLLSVGRYKRVRIAAGRLESKLGVKPPTTDRWTIRPIKIRAVVPSTQAMDVSLPRRRVSASVDLTGSPLRAATSLERYLSSHGVPFSLAITLDGVLSSVLWSPSDAHFADRDSFHSTTLGGPDLPPFVPDTNLPFATTFFTILAIIPSPPATATVSRTLCVSSWNGETRSRPSDNFTCLLSGRALRLIPSDALDGSFTATDLSKLFGSRGARGVVLVPHRVFRRWVRHRFPTRRPISHFFSGGLGVQCYLQSLWQTGGRIHGRGDHFNLQNQWSFRPPQRRLLYRRRHLFCQPSLFPLRART